MDLSPAIPQWVAAAAAAAVAASVVVYGQFCRRISYGAGKVRADEFGIPDLFVGSLFFVWFAAVIANGFRSEPAAITTDGLIQGALMFCGIVTLVAAFLRYRGIALRAQFGVGRMPWWKVPAFALAFYVAAIPIVLGSGALVQVVRGGVLERQPIVNFFSDAVRSGDHRAALATLLMGAVVAPIAEEFLFRGYIYGVLKRYLGWSTALLLSAVLFSSIHVNAASLVPLFIFAITLTIAYEVTGSLLVNIMMHAFFNTTMFIALYFQARAPL